VERKGAVPVDFLRASKLPTSRIQKSKPALFAKTAKNAAPLMFQLRAIGRGGAGTPSVKSTNSPHSDQGFELRLAFAVEVRFATDFYRLEILYKEFAVCSLLVSALFVYQPYYVQTILTTVIPNTKDAANIVFPIWSSIIASSKAER
jgi:hypothetical protein